MMKCLLAGKSKGLKCYGSVDNLWCIICLGPQICNSTQYIWPAAIKITFRCLIDILIADTTKQVNAFSLKDHVNFWLW